MNFLSSQFGRHQLIQSKHPWHNNFSLKVHYLLSIAVVNSSNNLLISIHCLRQYTIQPLFFFELVILSIFDWSFHLLLVNCYPIWVALGRVISSQHIYLIAINWGSTTTPNHHFSLNSISSTPFLSPIRNNTNSGCHSFLDFMNSSAFVVVKANFNFHALYHGWLPTYLQKKGHIPIQFDREQRTERVYYVYILITNHQLGFFLLSFPSQSVEPN